MLTGPSKPDLDAALGFAPGGLCPRPWQEALADDFAERHRTVDSTNLDIAHTMTYLGITDLDKLRDNINVAFGSHH
jgi:hypothetical protein